MSQPAELNITNSEDTAVNPRIVGVDALPSTNSITQSPYIVQSPYLRAVSENLAPGQIHPKITTQRIISEGESSYVTGREVYFRSPLDDESLRKIRITTLEPGTSSEMNILVERTKKLLEIGYSNSFGNDAGRIKSEAFNTNPLDINNPTFSTVITEELETESGDLYEIIATLTIDIYDFAERIDRINKGDNRITGIDLVSSAKEQLINYSGAKGVDNIRYIAEFGSLVITNTLVKSNSVNGNDKGTGKIGVAQIGLPDTIFEGALIISSLTAQLLEGAMAVIPKEYHKNTVVFAVMKEVYLHLMTEYYGSPFEILAAGSDVTLNTKDSEIKEYLEKTSAYWLKKGTSTPEVGIMALPLREYVKKLANNTDSTLSKLKEGIFKNPVAKSKEAVVTIVRAIKNRESEKLEQ